MGVRPFQRLGLAGLALGLAACTEPNPGVNDVLPPLVVVTGHVVLPSGFRVSDAAATVGSVVLLGPPGAGRDRAIAAGRVVTPDGFFSVSVPTPTLPAAVSEYEIQVDGTGASPQLAAPLALSSSATFAIQDVNGATTIVAMDVRKALSSGQNPTGWSIASLAALPQVQQAVPDLISPVDSLGVTASSQATGTTPRQGLELAVAAVLQAAGG